MHWLLQENNFNEPGWAMLKNILEKTETPHTIHKVVPFVGEIIPDIDPEGPVVCMGSYSLRHVAKRKGWTPGVWDLEPHTYADCCVNWQWEMLNYEASMIKLKNIFSYVQDNNHYFIRPNGDNKYFSGGVKSSSDIEYIHKCVANLKEDEIYYGLNMDTDIIINEVMDIYSEYRNWIIDGQLITSSLYKMGAKVIYSDEVDSEVTDYVKKMVDIWQPERAFVIDVAKTEMGMRIVEINTLNAAGFYAGDTYKLFEAIEGMKY